MATTTESGNTYVLYEAAGGETTLTFEFPALDVGHVKVSINNVVKVQNTDFTVNLGTGTVTFDGTLYPTGLTAGDDVKIWRSTEWLTRLVDFASGSQVTEDDLDRSALQKFYLIQEIIEGNIAGTVTIDIGPGSGGDGDAIGGINVIDTTMSSDSPTIALGTSGLTKGVIQLYRNGVFVPPSDWEINPAGDTITVDYNFLTGDKVNVLYLFGSIVTTINTSVVTSASILDGAVTTTKIADGAVTSAKIADGTITYADLAVTGAWDEDWDALDGTEPVADMLNDLNDRLEAVAAGTADQFEMQSFTLNPTTTSLSKSFGFTPDYVVVHVYRVKETYGAITVDEYPQGSFIVLPGTQTHSYRLHLGSGPGSASFTTDFTMTLGTSLLIALSGSFTHASAEFVFKAVAYKEA